jgi:hypothetical protein
MKQRKIALSLAVVGAIAAPFVFHTYKEFPRALNVWTPLTAEEKDYRTTRLKETNNCQTNLHWEGETEADSRRNGFLENCRWLQKTLKEGGSYVYGPSIPLYLALNAAVAIPAFILVFGLTYLPPAVALWAALAVLWVGYVLAQPVSYYDDFHALQVYVASSHHDPADLDDDADIRRHKDALSAELIRSNPGLQDLMRQKLMRNNESSMEDNLYLWPYLQSTSPWAINRVVFAFFPPVISLLAGLAFVWVWPRHGEAHWLKLPARLRRGSLRLYLVVAVPWVAWFGFQILINGPRWPYLTRAFCWLLLVPIGGPILALLIVWVVAGFKGSAPRTRT